MKQTVFYLNNCINRIIDFIVPRRITPNMLTMFRIFLTPVIFYFVYFFNQESSYLTQYISRDAIIFNLFFCGIVTDFMDGRIARARNMQSEWGTRLDAIADKIFFLAFVFLLYNLSKLIFAFIFLLQIITVVIAVFSYFEKKQKKVTIFGRVFAFVVFIGFCFILFGVDPFYTKLIFSCSIPLSMINIGLLAKQ